MHGFIKKNIKVMILLLIVIMLSITGYAVALQLSFDPVNVSVTATNIVANIRFEKDKNGEDLKNIISTGNLIPITVDNTDINNIINSDNILKFKFWISGSINNPKNSIYDIALSNISLDCELKKNDVKWVLYKNKVLLSEGNFSPEFDAMINNRMLLTNTQNDLTDKEDEYLFALYIQDTCSSSDINECISKEEQKSYLGKKISAMVSIETAAGRKKENIRTTSPSISCTSNNINVQKPKCELDLTYNGDILNLINNDTISKGVTFNQTTAITPGNYTITASLEDGYQWEDGLTSDYVFTCAIAKRKITVTTLNQFESSFVSKPEHVSASNLINNHHIKSINLSRIATNEKDVIAAGAAIIYDENNKDVTNYYSINYQNLGKIVKDNT